VPRPRLRMAGTVGMVAKAKPRKGTRPRKVDILRPMDVYNGNRGGYNNNTRGRGRGW